MADTTCLLLVLPAIADDGFCLSQEPGGYFQIGKSAIYSLCSILQSCLQCFLDACQYSVGKGFGE
ncbi:hypothetical protein [Bacteroides rodentium]|uniref:hypothetical protein n=1 Tax=Bacteroides rodentium TaxID=691816 RepID=UPI001FCCB543|nr:hypothetical protein [Bacteroides rodentium]